MLLADDDPDAQAQWETHAPLLKAHYFNGAEIEAAINDFAYEQALELLNEAESMQP
jgi:hypothetical protein